MKRGEVWWVERPHVGRRPYLVMTRDSAIGLLRSVVAIPATRTARGIPTEVPLTTHDGMPADCVLTLDNLTLIPKALFVDKICHLQGNRLAQVCTALAYATDCD